MGDASTLAETIRGVPARVASAVAGANDDALRRRPARGEWSPIEVVGHLADKFEIWLARAAAVVATVGGTIDPYDQDAVVRDRGHQGADVGALLDKVRASCDAFADAIATWNEAALAHTAFHPEYGMITARECIELPLASVHDHLRQIEEALGAA
ncbi:MAG TPA: DinB family protein [Acidimicrobiia bacterium]|nr:DinB family protein [Acidimicrobiia bacterium]